jgi:hypothetical protein
LSRPFGGEKNGLGSQPNFAVVNSHSASQTPIAISRGPWWTRNSRKRPARGAAKARIARIAAPAPTISANNASLPQGTTSGRTTVTTAAAAQAAAA